MHSRLDPLKLDTQFLKLAYANGYFPMPHPETGEILWYNPDPRALIPLNDFHSSRSLLRKIRRNIFEITYDQNFEGVISGCADRKDTWINAEFKRAYSKLYREGYAHSIEAWHKGKLVGGIYGVTLGGAFFAESKFHYMTDASKVALYQLVRHLLARKYKLLEVQFMTDHLASLGAIEIPAKDYYRLLNDALMVETSFLPDSGSGH